MAGDVPYVLVEESDRPLTLDDLIKYAIEQRAVKPADGNWGETFHVHFPDSHVPRFFTRDELTEALHIFNSPNSGK